MSEDTEDFRAFEARYSYGRNDRALHTHTPYGFYSDGWKDGRATYRPRYILDPEIRVMFELGEDGIYRAMAELLKQ